MSSHTRSCVVIFNPVKIDETHIREAVLAYTDAHSWGNVAWVETTQDDPGEGQAAAAAEQGADLVIACGGDGTVRAVASGLHGTSIPMAIVPQGTGNLLARNLQVPLDLRHSVEVAFGGRDREIDFCYVDLTRPDGTTQTLPFAVIAGVGIDAQMIKNTDDEHKKRFGPLAYAVAVLRSLGGGDRLKLAHQLDDGPFRRTSAHSVIVGNCGELVGSIHLIPDAEPDDGILDILIMRPKDLLGWVQITGRLLRQMVQKSLHNFRRRPGDRVTGEHKDIKSLRYSTARTFHAKLNKPEEFEVDGDTVGKVTEFEVRIQPPSLLVRVPDQD